MEPFIVTLVPTETEEFSTHVGQEFLYVLEGELKVQVADHVDLLKPRGCRLLGLQSNLISSGVLVPLQLEYGLFFVRGQHRSQDRKRDLMPLLEPLRCTLAGIPGHHASQNQTRYKLGTTSPLPTIPPQFSIGQSTISGLPDF